jgi:Domain of Unknown Function (DUF1080)
MTNTIKFKDILFTFIVLFISTIAGFSQKKTAIFNKKDLTGWTIYGTEKWYVAANGELVCESGPDKGYGYLGTNKTYKDFELTLQFKQEADGNSGVFFHSSITGTRVAGWQVEVAPKGHDTGGIYESYKRGWIIKPDKSKDDALKVGKWNKMKIRVQGNHVITWLNGTEMVNHTDEAYGSVAGSIALQIHDGGGIKVRWKKLEIREL